MNTIKKLVTDAENLERRLAGDIAQLADALDPLPQARDASTLDDAWRHVTFSRSKLANFLKDTLASIDVGNSADAHQRHQLRKAKKDLKAVRKKLGLWTRVRPIVSAQLVSERRSLIENDVPSNPHPGILDQVVSLFMKSMHILANPHSESQGEQARRHGCHRDIPYPMYRFSRTIGAAHRVCLALRRQRPLRFLDVGSGGGTKVLAATTCFDHCDGLEYDADAVSTGRRFLEILEPERCSLIQGDALRFSDYGSYDVIYFYRPMMDSGKLDEMEERIVSQAKRGTVLLKVGGIGADLLPYRGAHEVADQVYVTGMSAGEASELARSAERMGTMTPGFSGKPLSRFGYWKPLLEVSGRNGYFI